MPFNPVIERQEVDASGAHDIVNVQSYEAPADPETGLPVTHDEFKDFDIAGAKAVKRMLDHLYPGHLWAVVSDLRQGIVKFSIPILMGINNWWLVNLRTTPLTPLEVMRGGGEILERYGLARGRFDLASFLDARAKHSALVVPGRRVPG